MNNKEIEIAPFAKAAVQLLKGPVFDDDLDLWQTLALYQVDISRYFEKIGLDLIVDTRDGYAYLKQFELDESGKTIGLIQRRPLSYELSLVCVLLREWLQEFENDDLESKNLYITPKSFRERVELFFEEKANELKFIKELDKHFLNLVEMKFLKLTYSDKQDKDKNQYEVKRIIKARVTNDDLERFKNLLEEDV